MAAWRLNGNVLIACNLKRAGMAASKVFRVEGGVQYDHSAQYAAFSSFECS